MLGRAEWQQKLVDEAARIADRGFQERAWFGLDAKAISSPDEMINIIFGDFIIEEFVAKYGAEFTEPQAQAAREFVMTFGAFADSTPKFPDPRKVIDDPAWRRVREAAAQFVSAFQQ